MTPMQFSNIRAWGFPVDKLFLAAGPCSAESEFQVMAIAEALAKSGASFMRAGLWKPRTHPGTFEGVGIKGIAWLLKARKEFGLHVGVEVALPDHVRACIDMGVDAVWIGARTTVNPFAVQDLANALEGCGLPVLVKNPINPDVELWVGAIERLYGSGIRKIAAIHRGFSSSRESMYRYVPNWRIPIELKRRLPDLPMICDPSHICGNTDLIFSVAQEAIDLLFDGLMVEVHNDPPSARSDAKQQLTPALFHDLVERLTLKHENTKVRQAQTRLRELRAEVDRVDDGLLALLARRMELVHELGEVKRMDNISTLQPHRWREMLEQRILEGDRLELSADFVQEIFETVHEEAIQRQIEDEGLLSLSSDE